jgi:hypothetical protein
MLQNRRKYVKDKESGKRSSKIEITKNLRGDFAAKNLITKMQTTNQMHLTYQN